MTLFPLSHSPNSTLAVLKTVKFINPFANKHKSESLTQKNKMKI